MVDVSSQNNSISINVSSSGNSASIKASPDTAQYYSEKSREYAISDKLIDGKDYSAKYYAGKAKESENASKNYAEASQAVYQQVQDSANDVLDNIETNKTSAIEEIETIKTNAVNTANEANTTINTNKTNAINEINTTKNSAVSSVNTTKTSAITEINNTKTTAVNAVNTSKNQALNDIEKESSSIVNFKEEVNAELENKVDLDDMVAFEMREVPCIVETYVNGFSWYRVYSDGWCEQGGKFSISKAGTATITFLKEFKDTNYYINPNTITNGNYVGSIYVKSQTTTGITAYLDMSGGSGTYTCLWYACGYIA